MTAVTASPATLASSRIAGPVLAIDPGSSRSAWVLLAEDGSVDEHDLTANDDLIWSLEFPDPYWLIQRPVVVIEQIESYGMAVGAEVFATVHWAGRFYEAARWARAVVQVPRREVKLALCGSSRAKDANIRQAVLDLYGGGSAKGTKKAPGPLYGIRADEWQALALARAYMLRPEEAG